MSIQKENYSKAPDYVFMAVTLFLLVFGLIMLTSASSDLGRARFGDSYYYLKHQLVYGVGAGFLGFIVGYFIYYRVWEKISVVLLALSLISLILVFTPIGFEAYGAERWLNIFGVTIQPGELLKLTFLIYLASWIGKNTLRSKSFSKGFLPFIFLVGVVIALLLAQPATSTAAIIFIASVLMYFSGGAKLKFIFLGGAVCIATLTLIVYLTPYRLSRITSFLDKNIDELGSTYHINQALNAIGSGGIAGVGFGQSTTKLKYLPEPISDSIFAVVGEELGFIGSLALVLLFLFFIMRGFRIAKNAPDKFSQLLVIGFTSLIGIQAFVNMAAISGVIPLTGVPLPFISFGGTALAVFLTMSGIIANISKYR